MPQRRILFLDATHLTAYLVGGGKVVREGSFPSDQAGLAAFAAYLAEHRRSLFLLLADVAEEGFQLEDIPNSSGRDRIAIFKRKLAQYFYGTPFSVARSQGRLKTGRRDERILLMALTQPQHFEPWLAVLDEAKASLAGIYSVSQLVGNLLPANAPDRLLVITRTRGGLRQTFFADRQLRFSRLTPLATGTAEESAIAAAVEAAKMHQYLTSQRLIERNKPLATRVLVHPAQVSALRERCRDSVALRFEFLDLLQEEKRFALHSTIADSQAELLFCHLLGRNVPKEQFARSQQRRYYRLWQTRFALKSASAVLCAGVLLFAAKQGLDIHGMQTATEQLRQQTRIDRHAYDTALQALPKTGLSTDNLRALVDRYDQVAKRAVGPVPLLVQLSRSLDAFPGVALDSVEWRIVEQPTPQPGTTQVAGQTAGPFAEATVSARLPIGMVGDHRGQLNLVADFARHLGSVPETQVVMLQSPVDTQSGKTLKSGDERRSPEAPRFSFRLARKL
jgi:hypothetical protein